jgi:hypothetical protein
MAKSNEKKRDFFWLSYSDLMTSLFFVMLVLFVLVYTMQNKMIGELGEKGRELDRIKEIEKTINNIDKRYFIYDSINKKHILNIDFRFGTGSYDFFTTNRDVRKELIEAGRAIKALILKFPEEQNIKYQVVIEGQASRDGYYLDEFKNNDILSYHRAQALTRLWKSNQINLDEMKNCELIVAGSGEKGIPRTKPDIGTANQRFLITIIPKIGQMKNK